MKCPKCGHKWEDVKAVAAAHRVNCEEIETTKQVLEIMPKYEHSLPRRAWIKKFKENLNSPDDPRFIDLK